MIQDIKRWGFKTAFFNIRFMLAFRIARTLLLDTQIRLQAGDQED